jgi:hypothetical protein
MAGLRLCSCATAQVLYLALPAMLSAVAWSTRGIQACLNHLLSLFSPGVLVLLPSCAAQFDPELLADQRRRGWGDRQLTSLGIETRPDGSLCVSVAVERVDGKILRSASWSTLCAPLRPRLVCTWAWPLRNRLLLLEPLWRSRCVVLVGVCERRHMQAALLVDAALVSIQCVCARWQVYCTGVGKRTCRAVM